MITATTVAPLVSAQGGGIGLELDALSDETTIRVLIRGRVQGVGYRHWTAGIARDLGLGGWVRNRRDGTVEAVFAGAEQEIQYMLMELNAGPPAAEVSDVQPGPYAGPVPQGFSFLPTA